MLKTILTIIAFGNEKQAKSIPQHNNSLHCVFSKTASLKQQQQQNPYHFRLIPLLEQKWSLPFLSFHVVFVVNHLTIVTASIEQWLISNHHTLNIYQNYGRF